MCMCTSLRGSFLHIRLFQMVSVLIFHKYVKVFIRKINCVDFPIAIRTLFRSGVVKPFNIPFHKHKHTLFVFVFVFVCSFHVFL
eukprot:m.216638 g.216638  ORF g.216638 m.216638 type:complete len:84 (+) comp13808_c3_seq1:3496-3747(+)